ncbi:MAG: sigma-70 family RNA polymerase sigma factor [Anaerolineae bacterium]|jgi:RNA polymerase sigma-70 factor (ECF subfamily)|nr:sigma-70 family RNA polymerase sigma factor [Anaerolineae bacterium]
MTQADENALVEAAQCGELSAFNTLISAYQQQAYGIAYRILGDADSAADAMQDSFIKVYNRIHQFRGGSFKAWLFRVVINTCYDRMRGDRRRRAKLLDGDEILPEHDYRLIDAKPTPHEKAESSELMSMLMAEIRKLPKEQQQVLILCDLQGLAYHEAASVTGSNLGTVKSRLSRARAKMRDALTKNGVTPQAAQVRAQAQQRAQERGQYGYPVRLGAAN